MNVTDAVLARSSIRAFQETPVPHETLREVLELAARAPSGGNVQPWIVHVVADQRLAQLKAQMRERVAEAPEGEPPEYPIYPSSLWEPHRTERFRVGEQLYELLGISRNDKAGRLKQIQRNYDCFDAPAALFCYVDRRMDRPQWADVGMFLQTVMLLLQERGIGTCAQEAWALYSATVSSFLGTPTEHMLFCGLAIGYADKDARENQLRSTRLPLESFVTFHV